MSEVALTFTVKEIYEDAAEYKKVFTASCEQYPDVHFNANTKEEALIGVMGAVSTELICVEITRLNEELGFYEEEGQDPESGPDNQSGGQE